ncbi:5286_t:CDS:2 [Paraglomus brasilianum]|uniref:5286_t:CDS:1 n=1 Tax=Paraglomus brasilianum TaxID=144538 RepID=A0A9N8WAR6_9GLOM|nr:5286_t:CDS:2 [Paraglomus brasilianum]
MFYDLNIPYPVQHSQNIEYAQNELRKSIDTLVKFGYHIVAYNNTVTGKVASKKPNPIQKPNNEKIKQYTRLTVVIDDPGQNYGLTSTNSTISSYDLVAVQPTNEKLFQMACGTFDVDIISLEMGNRLPFYFKHTTVGLAIDRGIYFEISYAPAIRDSGSRRQLISNAQNLVRITRGRNIIITSDAQRAMELRGPYDIINLLVKCLYNSLSQLYFWY